MTRLNDKLDRRVVPRLRTVVGLRKDWFRLDVKDKMLSRDGMCNIESDPLGCNTGGVSAAIFQPQARHRLRSLGHDELFRHACRWVPQQ